LKATKKLLVLLLALLMMISVLPLDAITAVAAEAGDASVPSSELPDPNSLKETIATEPATNTGGVAGNDSISQWAEDTNPTEAINTEEPTMLRLLNWLYASKENYTFATMGVEGKDWEYAEDGVTITPLVTDEFFYTWQHKTMMFMDAESYDADDWNRYITQDSKSIPNKLIGFAFDSTPVQVEMAAMNAANSEHGNWLLYNSYEEWADTFLTKLEEAGYGLN